MQLRITVEIAAVKFRPLNSFEWAVLEILSSFTDHPPTTLEATEILCLNEPVFLNTAIESLTKIKAIQRRSEEITYSDLQSFVLSEGGKEIRKNEGWEDGHPESLSKEFKIEWPSTKIISYVETPSAKRKSMEAAPSNDEIQRRLTPEKLEEWLNSLGSELWKVKSFYITSVQRW